MKSSDFWVSQVISAPFRGALWRRWRVDPVSNRANGGRLPPGGAWPPVPGCHTQGQTVHIAPISPACRYEREQLERQHAPHPRVWRGGVWPGLRSTFSWVHPSASEHDGQQEEDFGACFIQIGRAHV